MSTMGIHDHPTRCHGSMYCPMFQIPKIESLICKIMEHDTFKMFGEVWRNWKNQNGQFLVVDRPITISWVPNKKKKQHLKTSYPGWPWITAALCEYPQPLKLTQTEANIRCLENPLPNKHVPPTAPASGHLADKGTAGISAGGMN